MSAMVAGVANISDVEPLLQVTGRGAGLAARRSSKVFGRAAALAGALALACVVISRSGANTGFGELAAVVGLAASPSSSPTPYKQDCLDTEESHMGLCYRKCALLTSGAAPYRRGATTCCKRSGFLSWFKCLMPKQSDSSPGLSVGGGVGTLAIPHMPGLGSHCHPDEEMWMSTCYVTCRGLTTGKYPVRTGPTTCCNGTAVTCKDPASLLSPRTLNSVSFDAGGGEAPSRMPHPPGPFQSDEESLNNEVYETRLNGRPKCNVSEELHAGMCYLTCQGLTNGEYSHRTGAESCCKLSLGPMCLFPGNTKTTSEFAVSMTGPPHTPGEVLSCLDDEELYLLMCYRKCTLMTEGQYPVRGRPDQCCASMSSDSCKTSPAYNQGGRRMNHVVHAMLPHS